MTKYPITELNIIAEEINILLGEKDIPEKIITLGNILEFILRKEEIPNIFTEHLENLVHLLTSGETVFDETPNGYDIATKDNEIESIYKTAITVTENDESVDFDFVTTTTKSISRLTFIITVSKEGIEFREYN